MIELSPEPTAVDVDNEIHWNRGSNSRNLPSQSVAGDLDPGTGLGSGFTLGGIKDEIGEN